MAARRAVAAVEVGAVVDAEPGPTVALRPLLRDAGRRLARHAGSDRAGALEAEVLLAAALGRRRSALLSLDAVSDEVAERFEALVAERQASARPVAYLLGRRGFRDFELAVDERVLVPRPETEGLIDVVLELMQSGALPAGPAIDRGTGSGALALALASPAFALASPACGRLVVGSDVSGSALCVAAINREALGRSLALVQADGLSPFADRCAALVVSNPPYVEADEWDRLPPDVRDHEPRQALVPGEGSVRAMYSRLSRQAARVLRPGGWLVTEVGAGQAAWVQRCLSTAGLVAVSCRADLAGIERVVLGRRPASAGAGAFPASGPGTGAGSQAPIMPR